MVLLAVADDRRGTGLLFSASIGKRFVDSSSACPVLKIAGCTSGGRWGQDQPAQVDANRFLELGT